MLYYFLWHKFQSAGSREPDRFHFHTNRGIDCFNPQARESLIMGTAFMALSSILFQSAGSREPDRNIKRYVGQLAEFQSAGSRGPDRGYEGGRGGRETSFNPQARESLISSCLIWKTKRLSFNPQARESLIPAILLTAGIIIGFNPQARESLIRNHR